MDKLPTKDSLYRRGMLLGNDINCPFCKNKIETATHILLYCEMIWKLWSRVVDWLGQQLILPQSLDDFVLIWNAKVWGSMQEIK